MADTTVYARWAKTDFVLPAELTTLEEKAFAGGAFTCMVLSENTNVIGKQAFADCPNLVCICIPNAEVSIDDTAFGDMAELFVYGVPESPAQTFAKEHGFVFKPIT